MAKDPEVTLEWFRSHSVTATQAGDVVDNEEVYGYFRTTWQGKPVAVTMQASRYATRWDSELTWTEWRVFAADCNYINDEGNRGDATTPTARTRLADVCRPYVVAWLEGRMTFAGIGATDVDYTTSRQWAFRNLAANMLRDCWPWESATQRVRAFLVKYAAEFDADALAALIEACDAYDTFSEAFRRITD